MARVKASSLLAVSMLYTVLAFVMTWPLAQHFTTHIPGDGGDGPVFVWNLWWVKTSLLDFFQLPFQTDFIVHPVGADLTFHTLTLGNALVGIPLQHFFNLPTTLNLIYIGSIVLSAVGTFLLCRQFSKSTAAAVIGGVVFAFNTYFFAQSLGHFNLTTTLFFPWLAYALVCLFKYQKIRFGILLGVVAGFTFLDDYYYTLYCLIFGVLFIIFACVYYRSSLRSWKVWLGLLFATVVALIISLPLLINVIRLNNPAQLFAMQPIADVDYYSADLARFVTPSFLNPLLGGMASWYQTMNGSGGVEGSVYVGWIEIVTAASAVVLLFRKHFSQKAETGFWLGITGLSLLLALGPTLHIAGKATGIPLLYTLLYNVPYFGFARVPARFTIMAMMGLAVIVSIVLSRFFVWMYNSKLSARLFARRSVQHSLVAISMLVVPLCILAEHAAIPLHLQDMRVPAVYQQIASDPIDGVVLELPFGVVSGYRKIGMPVTVLQYYQTVHHKKILNGSVSRLPDAAFDYFLNQPGLRPFILPDTGLGTQADSATEETIRAGLDDLGVRYIILHKDMFTSVDAMRARDQLEFVLEHTLNLTPRMSTNTISLYVLENP